MTLEIFFYCAAAFVLVYVGLIIVSEPAVKRELKR